VYESGNTIIVADDNSGNLPIIDKNTHQTVGAVQVGGAAFELVVNQRHGKVYVASRLDCCTSGITPGNGQISLVDATTHQVITSERPRAPGVQARPMGLLNVVAPCVKFTGPEREGRPLPHGTQCCLSD